MCVSFPCLPNVEVCSKTADDKNMSMSCISSGSSAGDDDDSEVFLLATTINTIPCSERSLTHIHTRGDEVRLLFVG